MKCYLLWVLSNYLVERKKMNIREAADSDLNEVLSVERLAFGYEKEANLVKDLLNDTSAKPTLSLLAVKGEQAVGHILFSKVRLTQTQVNVSAAILAPLAVVPDAQSQGVGGRLIESGLQRLKKSGVELVFVLGHPEYYPHFGFKPAGQLGFEAPYPIPDEHAGAWMVQELRPGIIGSIQGKVICSDELNKPEHWRE
jgi:putative acetyltransferase